jgi:hypothetical protein
MEEGKQKYRFEVLDTLAALAWKTVRENIKISVKESLGYCELKKHELQPI